MCLGVTVAPSVIGFQIQTNLIRPAVISAVPTVRIISREIANSGKLVKVSAIAVVCGVAPYHISVASIWLAVVEAINSSVVSRPPPATSLLLTPTLSVPPELAKSTSQIA